MVEQPSGRGDEQIGTGVQAAPLRLHADPAEDHRAAHVEVPAVLHGRLANLRGKLARRRDDQRPRAARRPAAGEVLQDGQQEGGGLPGPGLRTRDQVLPVERGRNDARLDGRGSDVAGAVDGAQELRAQAQLFELHGGAYSDLRAHPGAERCLSWLARRPGPRSQRRIWRRERPEVDTGNTRHSERASGVEETCSRFRKRASIVARLTSTPGRRPRRRPAPRRCGRRRPR